MKEIRELLKLDQWPDLVVGPYGYAAKRRTDVAPLAYEILINAPLSAPMVEKVLKFAGNADSGLTRSLFTLCNGLRVGATKFVVYGVLGQIDRASGDVAYHPPLDINVPNIYERPVTWPDDLLIVGSSTETDGHDATRKMFHAITPGGRIIVAEKLSFSTISREYRTVSQWLAGEVARALKDTERY